MILQAVVSNCEIDTENVYPIYKEPFATIAVASSDSDPPGGLNVERVPMLRCGDRDLCSDVDVAWARLDPLSATLPSGMGMRGQAAARAWSS